MPLVPNAQQLILQNPQLRARWRVRQLAILKEMQGLATAEFKHHNTKPKDLHESWVSPRPYVDGGHLVAAVGNDAPHVVFLVRGTRPHVIRPKPSNPRGRLFFFWEKVGHYVSPKQVNHPGTKANDFMQRAVIAGVKATNR